MQHLGHELIYAVRLAGSDYIVPGLLLLQHGVHGTNIVAGEAPVAARLHVTQLELVFLALRPVGGGQSDLAGHHLRARGAAIRD